MIYAARNQLSVISSPRHHNRLVGLHHDSYREPTWGTSICLWGMRYLVLADVTVDEIDPNCTGLILMMRLPKRPGAPLFVT